MRLFPIKRESPTKITLNYNFFLFITVLSRITASVTLHQAQISSSWWPSSRRLATLSASSVCRSSSARRWVASQPSLPSLRGFGTFRSSSQLCLSSCPTALSSSPRLPISRVSHANTWSLIDLESGNFAVLQLPQSGFL